jgi:hypothetical protein
MLIALDINRLQINETTENIDRFINYNKKFWEQLIFYLPCYGADSIEKDVSSNSSIVACVFVAAAKFLPGHCLATIGDTHTD